ncbi:MAG: hypothetical protein ACFB0B_02415 [Thermonemataceae bacterium]
MKLSIFNKLLLFSLFFLAYWFFGNLYEEIVLAPNNLVNSYEALVCWQGFFQVTNQIHYYVPFTQLAVLVVYFLYFKSNDKYIKELLKRASIFGLASIAITVYIVTQLNLKLFFGDLETFQQEIYNLSLIWLIVNFIRICLVGSTLYFVFKAYLRFQAKSNTQKG